MGPEDLDVVELQDTDAARYVLSAEELGLCRRSAGGRWLRGGGGAMTSSQPVNPSGGLLSKGEPLGASALGQAVEIIGQLRGTCGPRQISRVRCGLSHTVGRGANACVVIFGR
jgi:acetyl-CoA acetyltransferase